MVRNVAHTHRDVLSFTRYIREPIKLYNSAFFFFLLPALCLFPLFAYGSYKRQTYRLGGRAVAALLNILALFFFYSYVRNCGQDIIALLAYTSLVILHQALAVCEHMVQTILEVMSYFMLARLFFF